MRKFHVNIFIETSGKGFSSDKRAGEWLVEFVTDKGIPVIRNGVLCRENITGNAFVLELLKEALSILTKPCSIRVNTRCGHVIGVLRNGWQERWEKNGWVNAKGKPVKNMELWQQVYALLRKHTVEIDSGKHPYRMMMQNDVRKEMDKKNGK